MEENLYEFDYMIINVESCLNGSLNVFFVDLNSEASLENIYNKYAQQQHAMYVGTINYDNKMAYLSNTTYVFMCNWSMMAMAAGKAQLTTYDKSTKTWMS